MSPAPPEERTLREVIDTLGAIERRAGSDGERRAAEWIAGRLTSAGCPAEVEEVQFRDGYARLMSTLAGTSAAAGLTALLSRRPAVRKLAGAAAAAVSAAIADDVSNGPRLARRASGPPKTTWNVVAQCGDLTAERTLVVLAHHDAATAGKIFDDRGQRWFGRRFPGLLERWDTPPPLWWMAVGVPAVIAAGAARGRSAMLAAGTAVSALGVAVFEDIARSPVVPGANDNLSGVAAMIALAHSMRERPPIGLRVVLASCGAEEVLQGGVYGFAERHFPTLDHEQTWFVNLETVGSPRLIMLEGEGPVVMEDYPDVTFRDLVAGAAQQTGVPLRRGMRARFSTDSIVPSRAGYPITTLASVDRYKALSNYHKPSDTPQNVNYRTVRQAVTVVEAVARELAANPWVGGV